MNLPNKLTLIRAAMIPVFVVLAVEEQFWTQLCAAAVFSIACLTDYFDGQIARRRNIVTNFGKFADPIADKILVMSALVILVEQGRMPSWVCITMLAREFAISGFRLVAVNGGKVIAAGKLGKYKTVTQMFAVIMLLLLVPVGGTALLGTVGVVASKAMMYLALALTVWSGVDYIVKNYDCIRDLKA